MSGKKETEKVGTTLTISYGLNPLTRREKLKEFAKFLVIFLLAVGITASILYLSFSIVGFFPDYVPIQSVNDLLKILIEVDGILLGFGGIIVAQLLSSIMDQQNILYQSILEKPEKASAKAKSLEFLDRRKFVLSITACSTFVFLLLSILLAMVNIARLSKFPPTDVYSSFGTLFAPLLFVIASIVLLFLSLTGLPMKPPLESTRITTKPNST